MKLVLGGSMFPTALTRQQHAALKSSLRRAKERGLKGTIDFQTGRVIWRQAQTGDVVAQESIMSVLQRLDCD
jgi:phage host-nuclease inhibitor protein Gam